MRECIKKCLSLTLVICLLIATFAPTKTLKAETDIDSSAKAMVVIDANSKRVLLSKDKDMELAMASTTKIMTALIALENTKDLDEIFKIDNRAVGIEGTSIYLEKDEEMSMLDLLYGLMLASGNDSACAIAYRVGNGELSNFVELMNKKCEELNLKHTHFDNPHGLDSKTHYTSAYDLAIITSKAMENETFRKIVSTKIKQLPSKNNSRFVRNKHKLLGVLDGCEGVKTGFTDNALRCCVTSTIRDGFRTICVVLNCPNMFEESMRLTEKAYNEYTYTKVYLEKNIVGKMNIINGVKDSVELYTNNACFYPLKKNENEKDKLKIEINYKEEIDAPIKKDEEIGDVKVYLDKDLIFSEKIYTMEEVRKIEISDKLKEIVENWY